MNFKRILFWVSISFIFFIAIRYYSEKSLEWVHWKRIALHTQLEVRFKGGSLDKIRKDMNVFLSYYDSALSDQFVGNALEILSHSPSKKEVNLNVYQRRLFDFILAQNISYENTYFQRSPFQIGIGEWLYYYNLFYQKNNLTKQAFSKSKVRILELLNNDYFIYNQGKGMLQSLVDSLKLTLGGVSKGLALVELTQILEKKAVQNFLINAGGDISYKGLNPEGKLWKIGIRDPQSTHYEQYMGILTLSPEFGGLATSGIYERTINYKGKKRHHIIDPFTGESVTDKQSLTVLAKDPLIADFYATFLFLLPKEKIFKEAKRLGIEVLFIDEIGNLHQTEKMKILFKTKFSPPVFAVPKEKNDSKLLEE